MKQVDLETISQEALNVVKPIASLSKQKVVAVYFKNTKSYTDSYIVARRKGRGLFGLLAPKPTDLIESIEINIYARPGVINKDWVGYALLIDDPESSPKVGLLCEWLKEGGDAIPKTETADLLTEHFSALLDGNTTSDGLPDKRQAPETMA